MRDFVYDKLALSTLDLHKWSTYAPYELSALWRKSSKIQGRIFSFSINNL